MHAVMNSQVHGSRFCQGLQYNITKFWLVNNLQSHIIVPGPYVYVFDEETEFEYVPELHPTLPLYWFNFVDIGIVRTKLGDSSNMSGKFYLFMYSYNLHLYKTVKLKPNC